MTNAVSSEQPRPVVKRPTMMRRGATFLEYALLAALIGIVGAAGVMFYGEKIKSFFVALGNQTENVTPSGK